MHVVGHILRAGLNGGQPPGTRAAECVPRLEADFGRGQILPFEIGDGRDRVHRSRLRARVGFRSAQPGQQAREVHRHHGPQILPVGETLGVLALQHRKCLIERRDCLVDRPAAVDLKEQPAIVVRHRQSAREARILAERQGDQERNRLVARANGLGHLRRAAQAHQRVGAVQPARRRAVPQRRRLVEPEAAPQFECLVEAAERFGGRPGSSSAISRMPRCISTEACASMSAPSET